MDAVRRAWEAFQDGEEPPPGLVRPAILESWRRSRELAISPDLRTAPPARGDTPAAQAAGRRLLAGAAGDVTRRLSDELAGSGWIVALADATGVVLECNGDRGLLRRAEAGHMAPGAAWAEGAAGTNGISLSLSLGRPAHVGGAEHFCAGWHAWSCTGSPVHHPITGEVLGALVLIAPARGHDPRMVGALARRTAWQAQHAMAAELVTGRPRGATLREVEREAIVAALEAADGSVTAAAQKLGISRATLYRRLRTYRVLGGEG